MTKENSNFPKPNRRDFIKNTAKATAAISLIPTIALGRSQSVGMAKPNSRFGGVQIGVITYSYRSMEGQTAEDILEYIVQSGISSVELMADVAERYAGIPQVPRRRRNAQMTAEQEAEFKKAVEERVKWRSTVSMDAFKKMKKMFNKEGVNIHIAKFGDIGSDYLTDAEIDYMFKAAAALGAQGITREMSQDAAKVLGPFADKHDLMIGFHNHLQIRPDSYDKGTYFSSSKNMAMNLDVGHFFAANGISPIPLIEKYAAQNRILSLHLKDRKANEGDNMPWGQGDTPLKEILLHCKEAGYKFPLDVELEYPIPEDSNAVKEVKRCVEFCKDILA